MLDFVRTHRRLIFLALLILVFPSFVFFGVQGYSHLADSSHTAAQVDGQIITTRELDERLREQTERLRQMLGAQYDPRQFEGPQGRRDALDSIIAQQVLTREAARIGLTLSGDKIRDAILQIPEVAALRRQDGAFDQPAYVQWLARQGMTSEQFEDRVRTAMLMQQIPQAIVTTALTPKWLAEHLIQANGQQRDVQELRLKPADYAGKVSVDEPMLKAYYDAHPQAFAVPEQIRAEYIVFSGEDLMARIPVTPEQIKTYYEQNAARFKIEEQRRAAHLLIKLPDGADAAARAAAKKRADDILTALRKRPADFAALARKFSDDPGSAAQGGELGFLARGATVPPFERALFELKQPGDISQLVESSFGFHIIRLEAVKGGGVQPMEAVKAELERDVRAQLANQRYAELAEAFSSGVEDHPDSLKPVADRLKLSIQTVDHVTRAPNPALSGNPINQDALLKALFADDAIQGRRNTQAVQIGPTTLIAARVASRQPASIRTLAEARQQIMAEVLAEQSAALAKKAGEAMLAAARQGQRVEGFGAARRVSREQAQGMPPAALIAVLQADTAKLPLTIGVDLGAQGYALYRINTVLPVGAVDPARLANAAQQLAQIAGQADFNAYYEALKARSKVTINAEAISGGIGSGAP